MTSLNNEQLSGVNGGAGAQIYPTKIFKCLAEGCNGTVTGSSSNGVEYEGTCSICNKLWDYEAGEAIG